jgi:outer membrane biosynthesis protein TonB
VSAARTKRRPTTARTTTVGFAAAIVVHIGVVGGVGGMGWSSYAAAPAGPGTGDGAASLPAMAAVALESTCAGDAALTAAGRSAECLAPWVGALDACLADVRVQLDAELARCTSQQDPLAVQIVKITPEDIARIDPEPLLEILEAAQQMKFEQQQQQQVAALEQQERQRQQEIAKQNAQVVEVAKPDTEIAPDNARFLSEHNTKVAKETVARGSRDEPMVAKSKPASLPAKENARDPSVAEPPEDKPPGTNPEAPDAPGKLSMRSPGAIVPSRAKEDAKTRGRYDGWHTPIADGLAARHGNASADRDARDAAEERGGGGAGGGTPPKPDLRASEDVLERALGGGSVDHLESIEDGEETALNAKRWVYASFFNRLKRQVAQNWEPASVWRRHDPDGSVYGFKSRVTQLRVSLDGKGKLSKTPTVIHPCGVDVLDEEAIRAFVAAAPFPNVPDGLAKDGLITFEFSFHFEIGSPRTSWRVIRQ